jgi:hypothetical protein
LYFIVFSLPIESWQDYRRGLHLAHHSEVIAMFRTSALTVALGLVSAAPAARADIIIEFTTGTDHTSGSFLFGQSLLTPTGGPWHNLTFNFFTNVPATTPTAAGTAFLLSQAYLDTPANLSSSTPGFLAASTSIVAGQYTFAPSVTVQPNTTYFVYENALLPIITGSHLASGNYITTDSQTAFQAAIGSTNFRLSGDVVTSPVPAPPAVVLVGLGAGCVALRRYVSRRATA